MSFVGNIPLIFLTIITIFSGQELYALDFREKLTGKINDISQSQGRFILERGSEDGLVIGDYVRVYLDRHLIGSAAVIDLEPQFSEWVFHRIYRHNSLKIKNEVQLISLYGDIKPEIISLEKYKDHSLLKEKRKKEKEDFIKNQMAIKEQRKEVIDKVIKDYDDYNSLKIPPISFELFVSPIVVRSHDRGKNFNYGAEIKNSNESQNHFQINYEYHHQSFKSYVPNNSYSMSRYQFDTNYFNNQIFGEDLKHTAILSFSREREGNIYPIKSQFRIGPVGLFFNFIKNRRTFKEISITYIPIKEYLSYETVVNTPEGKSLTQNRSSWRHHLQLLFAVEISPKLILSEKFIFRPSHQLITGTFDRNDSDILNSLSLNYEIFPSFSLGYQNRYSRDIRRKSSLGSPSTEAQNSLQIFYQFDKERGSL